MIFSTLSGTSSTHSTESTTEPISEATSTKLVNQTSVSEAVPNINKDSIIEKILNTSEQNQDLDNATTLEGTTANTQVVTVNHESTERTEQTTVGITFIKWLFHGNNTTEYRLSPTSTSTEQNEEDTSTFVEGKTLGTTINFNQQLTSTESPENNEGKVFLF